MSDNTLIPVQWIQARIDELMRVAADGGKPPSAMQIAALRRAEYYMDLLEAWKNRKR